MLFLIQYARAMHSIRRFLSQQGWLATLDHRAERSRWALWLRSLFSVLDFDDFATLDTPWWTLAAGRKVGHFLEKNPSARVIEWGSGASTLWLAKRSGSVISIESDPDWAARVINSVPKNVTLIQPTIPPASSATTVGSTRWGFRGLDFEHYVGAIDTLEGNFDLVVIDGRAREACFDYALQRLAPGGIILFDNTNRRRYQAALARHDAEITRETSWGLTPILMWPSWTSIIRKNTDYAATVSSRVSSASRAEA